MDSLLTELIEATEENIKGLKVIGLTVNTFVTETLIQHGRDEEAHSGLREKYVQSILDDVAARLGELEIAKSELKDIIQTIQDLEKRVGKLEK